MMIKLSYPTVLPDRPRLRSLWRLVPAYVCIALVVLLDRLSKYYIQHWMAWHYPTRAVPVAPILDIVAFWNRGASFGMLHDWTYAPWLFLALAVVAVLVLGVMLWRSKPEAVWMRLSIALILAGAMSNAIDRIRYGAVFDFLSFHWAQHAWPAFNIADVAISVGVGIMASVPWLEGLPARGVSESPPSRT